MHGETDKVFRRQDGPRRRTESGELMLIDDADDCPVVLEIFQCMEIRRKRQEGPGRRAESGELMLIDDADDCPVVLEIFQCMGKESRC